MSKELPYFKFEPAEYLTKDISFCSLSAQGLFINICSYYWQRGCELTKEQLLRRLNHEKELDELISEGVIDLENNEIKIKFLDSQLIEIKEKSKVNSINGSKGGRPRKNPTETEIKPNKNPTETEIKGIREDNIILNIMSEEKFIEYWKKCRMEYDNKITNIDKLDIFERQNFDKIKNNYSIERITDAVAGLFSQKNAFESIKLRPKHFLENFEKYLDCWDNNLQLFESKEKKSFKEDKL